MGDRVDIDGKKYIVEKISLLYSNFMRVDNHKATQMPHNILNGLKSIENITRSRFLQEQIMVGVHYETSVNDIQRLKQELMAFTSENSRDFQPELEVEVCDINNLDRLVLRIDICHRGNWANESVTLARRNKFMCALVGILKSIPIIAPLSGDPPVGEINRPMYTVAVSDGHAKDNIQKARAAKTARRWDYAPEEETDVDSHETMHKGPEITYSGSDAASITGTTAAGTTPFEAKADRLFAEDTRTLRRVTSNSSSMAISEMRGGVIVRGETKGRRRKAVQGDGPAVPPPGQASAPEQQVPRPVSQAPQPASQTASQQQLAATVLPAAALLPAEVLPPAGYPYV